jgi:Flp pilus assembly protein TadD
MKPTWTLAFVAAALLAVPAAAQTGAVRGKVVDEQGQPVDGAKVEISFKGGVTRKFETKTNKKGEYTQVGLQGGVYEIDVTKEGFQVGQTGGRVSLGDPTYMPEVKLRAGKTAAAGAAADKAVEELRAQFTKAAELAQSGKHEEAEAIYKDLLVKNPLVPELHYNLGFIYQQRKDWTAAEAAFKKAIEIRPAYSDAQTALASVYQSSGQGDKAMEVAKQSASGGDAKSQFNLGIVAMNQNKDEEALAAFQKAAELDPTFAEPYYFIGTRSMQLGRLPEAVAALEKYIAMAPASAANLPAAKQILPALKAALPKK